MLALLEGLAEHSLVVARPGADSACATTLLEPVGRYARSLLIGDEAARAANAHTGAFLDLAEQAAVGYEGLTSSLWLDRIEADEANLLVAIDRALDGGDSETAGRIVWAMWLYWFLRAKPLVGLKRALRCLTAELPPGIRARVHLAAATTAYAAGQVTVSAEHWEQGSALATEHDDAAILGAARAGTGLAALALGDLPKAEVRFREALPLTEQAGRRLDDVARARVAGHDPAAAPGSYRRASVEITQGCDRAPARRPVGHLRRSLQLGPGRGRSRATSWPLGGI